MKILKAMVTFSDDATGGIFHCDAIEYRGGIWLVPQWLEDLAKRVRQPVRIIRVDRLPLQHCLGSPFGDFVVPAMTLSKAVFEGRVQPSAPIEVMESPPIEIPTLPASLQ